MSTLSNVKDNKMSASKQFAMSKFCSQEDRDAAILKFVEQLQVENAALKEQLLIQQAVIEKIRYALKAYYSSSSDARVEDMVIEALTLQPSMDVLREHDIEVIEKCIFTLNERGALNVSIVKSLIDEIGNKTNG